jgi:phosphatidylglycerophosphate synthase
MEDNINQKGVLRRPIQARDTKWAAAIAQWLTKAGFRPNQISLLSIGFAAVAGACLLGSGQAEATWVRCLLLLSAAAGIQLRLLCNLFDGMVAVEGGFKTRSGEIFNEFPDRFSDLLVFLGAGYALAPTWWGVELGWTAALLAVLTAYIRALGGSAGASQQFCGPMAKPQRMAVMTAACLLSVPEVLLRWQVSMLTCALGIVVLGCVVTLWRRTVRVVKELERG